MVLRDTSPSRSGDAHVMYSNSLATAVLVQVLTPKLSYGGTVLRFWCVFFVD